MTDSDALAAVERWFRSRGIPHFIDHYSASRDVFTRVLAPLTAILMLELVTASTPRGRGGSTSVSPPPAWARW